MVKDHFLVVVPTHRSQLSEKTTRQLEQSLTYPSDFHILDGSTGKMNALNHALENLLTDKHTIYVTVDDDIILPENWQHSIACAFDRVPRLGVCGIDLDGTPDGHAVMANAVNAKKQRYKDVLFRSTIGFQNVAGACMAMPAKLAKDIGPYPYANDGRSHFIDEDGWRCHQAAKRGLIYGYVTNSNGVVQLVGYNDTLEYMTKKQLDAKNWEQNPTWTNR